MSKNNTDNTNNENFDPNKTISDDDTDPGAAAADDDLGINPPPGILPIINNRNQRNDAGLPAYVRRGENRYIRLGQDDRSQHIIDAHRQYHYNVFRFNQLAQNQNNGIAPPPGLNFQNMRIIPNFLPQYRPTSHRSYYIFFPPEFEKLRDTIADGHRTIGQALNLMPIQYCWHMYNGQVPLGYGDQTMDLNEEQRPPGYQASPYRESSIPEGAAGLGINNSPARESSIPEGAAGLGINNSPARESSIPEGAAGLGINNSPVRESPIPEGAAGLGINNSPARESSIPEGAAGLGINNSPARESSIPEGAAGLGINNSPVRESIPEGAAGLGINNSPVRAPVPVPRTVQRFASGLSLHDNSGIQYGPEFAPGPAGLSPNNSLTTPGPAGGLLPDDSPLSGAGGLGIFHYSPLAVAAGFGVTSPLSGAAGLGITSPFSGAAGLGFTTSPLSSAAPHEIVGIHNSPHETAGLGFTISSYHQTAGSEIINSPVSYRLMDSPSHNTYYWQPTALEEKRWYAGAVRELSPPPIHMMPQFWGMQIMADWVDVNASDQSSPPASEDDSEKSKHTSQISSASSNEMSDPISMPTVSINGTPHQEIGAPLVPEGPEPSPVPSPTVGYCVISPTFGIESDFGYGFPGFPGLPEIEEVTQPQPAQVQPQPAQVQPQPAQEVQHITPLQDDEIQPTSQDITPILEDTQEAVIAPPDVK